ncbi:MAG: GlsB/YeaQ/YmgE family stress response membrane protein [Actinomycetota bacterium]
MEVNWLWVLLVGLIVGAVARLLMPGRDPIGIIGTLVIGVLGAFLGTWLWNALLPDNDNEGVALFAGVVVAMILLWIYRKMTYGRRGAVR